MMSRAEMAQRPEDLTRLFVERANDGDAAGIAALYEEQAVMAYPLGGETVGREAMREMWEKVLVHAPHFELEPSLPKLTSGDIALTSTGR
jgi:ketosteroid isomerase-like protein